MVYNILNGDSLAYSFPDANIEGEIIVVREGLIDGELSGDNLHDFWQSRAKYMRITETEYNTSKLCNVLTTYILHEKLADKGTRVNAFDPGLTPGTGFAKNFPAVLRFLVNRIMPLFIPFRKNMNTPTTSGSGLANLAYAKELRHLNGIYYSQGKVTRSSTESYKKNYQLDLWKSSIELTGIQQQDTTISLS